MKKKKCLLDMDGVIADWHTAIAKHHGIATPYTWAKPGNWDICTNIGIVEADLWKGVDSDFWFNIPKTTWADDVVGLIQKYFSLDQICVLTRTPLTDSIESIAGCVEGKLKWLKLYFPKLLQHYLIGPSKEFCANEHSILIDDHEGNTDSFIKEGGHGLLFPRIWNRRHEIPELKILDYLDYELSSFMKGLVFYGNH